MFAYFKQYFWGDMVVLRGVVDAGYFRYPGAKVTKVDTAQRQAKHSTNLRNVLDIFVEPEFSRTHLRCPACGGDNLHGNGAHIRVIRDVPFLGNTDVYIHFTAKEFLCRNPACKKSFTIPFSGARKNAVFTDRFEAFLIEQAFTKATFAYIGNLYDVDADKVENLFVERAKELDEKKKYAHVKHLAVDEKDIQKVSKLVLVDTGQTPSRIIDICEGGRKKEGLKKALYSFEGYEKIETITIDMNAAYIAALDEVYPYRNGHPDTGEIIGPRVIIDRFHVAAYLMKAVETARRTLYENRQNKILSIPDAVEREIAYHTFTSFRANHFWFKKSLAEIGDHTKWKLLLFCKTYPEFAQLLAIKEQFKEIFDTSKDVEEAEIRYGKWVEAIPKEEAYREFDSFTAMVERHHREVFNYFMDSIEDGRFSNGPIEAHNGVIAEIIHMMRGASFEVVRAKILFGQTRCSDLKKVASAEEYKSAPAATSYTTAFVHFLDGLRTNEAVQAIRRIISRCIMEERIPEAATAALEDEYLITQLVVNSNMQGHMMVAAEGLDDEQRPPLILKSLSFKEFIKRVLHFTGMDKRLHKKHIFLRILNEK